MFSPNPDKLCTFYNNYSAHLIRLCTSVWVCMKAMCLCVRGTWVRITGTDSIARCPCPARDNPMSLSSCSLCYILQLKGTVCSPGGITIHGINTLEGGGLHGSLLSAVKVAMERAKELRDSAALISSNIWDSNDVCYTITQADQICLCLCDYICTWSIFGMQQCKQYKSYDRGFVGKWQCVGG